MVALEQRAVEIPINSRMIIDNRLMKRDDDEDEDATARKLTMEERAIYLEADALQIEMGNIIAKETGANSIIYDVAKKTQHKDRYTALAMALRYIAELEDKRKRKLASGTGTPCIGLVSSF